MLHRLTFLQLLQGCGGPWAVLVPCGNIHKTCIQSPNHCCAAWLLLFVLLQGCSQAVGSPAAVGAAAAAAAAAAGWAELCAVLRAGAAD
jgi:hypothetical protein